MMNLEFWSQALREALDEYLAKKAGGRSVPVPAAPLKPILIRRASELGLEFPPEGLEKTKFVDFLDMLPGVVKTTRRLGQDALVTRIEMNHQSPEPIQATAAAEIPEIAGIALRPDVFKAFTLFATGGKEWWYSKSTDRFIDQPFADSSDLVHVPRPTLADAIQDRAKFIETLTSTSHRTELQKALAVESTALIEFRNAVKNLRLDRQWHEFRLHRLTERIRAWSQAAGLPWSSGWNRGFATPKSKIDPPMARQMNAFLAGLMRLDASDAKRVMVPLDVVLKLLRDQ